MVPFAAFVPGSQIKRHGKNKFAQDKFVSRGFLSIGGKNCLPALSPKFLRAKLSEIIAIKIKKTFFNGTVLLL